ncbi:MAG: hypothetical protein GC180_04690 [Bacteroidetes bacterium]|nr:hypothetical protein [Bacteroidota bacterium]
MNKTRFLYGLIGLHLVFYLMALIIGGTKIADSYDYLYQAENLRESGSFYAWNMNEPIKPDYFTKRTPGYAVMLYLTGSMEWLILMLQNVMSIFVWWLVFRVLLKKNVREQTAAWLILGTLVLQSNALIYANSILSEIPFQLALFGGFWFLLGDIDKPGNRQWLWASLCFAAALLIKPVMLFFWLPLLGYATVRAMQRKRLQVIWPVFLLPLVVLLWSAYNQKKTGYAHYTSVSTVNLKDYNTRLMLESAYGTRHADSVISGINAMADTASSYEARNFFIQDTCKKLIAANKGAYAKVHLKGMLAMLLDPGRHDYVHFYKMDEGQDGLMYKLARGNFRGMWEVIRSQSPLIVFFFFLNLLGSLLLLLLTLNGLRALPNQTMLVILLCLIIGYFWVLTGPVGTARYKSAILPLMVVLAGLGLSHLKRF